MATITPDVYLSMGMTESEYQRFVELLGREPSMAELGMASVMWSEHCSYKCSRAVLAYFSEYKKAIEGEGLENAGVVPIGDGLAVTLKVESHNHPSAVEPYQGAATGVGGIIRDIFTMGARPIAMLNSLRFGPIEPGQGEEDEDVLRRNRYLFRRVVAGIAGYGNCVGIPTVAGEVNFHPRYSGNPLVNAMCVGIVDVDELATAAASGIGNPVLYLGSATGRDGIHGATFASVILDEGSQEKRPNVQIGDPFAEKLLIEATLEALATGAIVGIQDMGAAGLTCSITEMSAKGGVGMEIHLDNVPIREDDMSAYEIMLSESQERMLAVALAGREQEVIDVFRKWGVHAVVIGEVTDSGRAQIRYRGKLEVDAPARIFTDDCPIYNLPSKVPARYATDQAWDPSSLPQTDFTQALKALLSHPDIAEKRWVYEQFDQDVMTQTLVHPGDGDAAVLALHGTKIGLATKIDGNGRWTFRDPYVGGQLAVAEACRNVACTGARPLALTDGLNFGNPMDPEVYWEFERAVRGIADAAEAMGTPVVSGNVSFYNESDLGEILPTPMIGAVGHFDDVSTSRGISSADPVRLSLVCPRKRDAFQAGLGASLYVEVVHGTELGCPDAPDLIAERALCRWLSSTPGIALAHDVSDGGLAVALAEVAIKSRLGLKITVPADFTDPNSFLFGEFPGWVVVGHTSEDVFRDLDESLEWISLGDLGNNGDRFEVSASGNDPIIRTSVKQLSEWYRETEISKL
ncbi:MAG: phosphoribosylformylglycinamidine synthase subunit PurL [Fimbriimonadaceae bacterium]|nr:phosphoribosylformylglycinamidine synthase subunit PurL [Fimbriimonadaceae bacterium]